MGNMNFHETNVVFPTRRRQQPGQGKNRKEAARLVDDPCGGGDDGSLHERRISCGVRCYLVIGCAHMLGFYIGN